MSAIVAVVLIIGLTIAAGSFVYMVMIPFIKTETQASQACYYADMTIVEGDYTYLDTDTNELYVQIQRGERDSNIVGIQLKLSGGTRSSTVEARQDPEPSSPQLTEYLEPVVSLPGTEETRTYVINLVNLFGSADNIDFSIVEVAPIVQIGNKKSICDVRSKIII